MLKNAYLLAKIGADTAENERNFAEIWPKNGNDFAKKFAKKKAAPHRDEDAVLAQIAEGHADFLARCGLANLDRIGLGFGG